MFQYGIVFIQAFVFDGHSLLSKVPRKSLEHLSSLGSYKTAFDLKRHPALTGLNYKFDFLCLLPTCTVANLFFFCYSFH